MSTPIGDLSRQASALDEKDRATLAGLLLIDEDVESAWEEEIERRVGEIDANCVELVSWEEVKTKLMKRTGD